MDDHLNHLPPSPKERQCYYWSNGELYGPVPSSHLQELASKQLLTPDDLVWFDHHQGPGIPLKDLNLTTRLLLEKSRTNKTRLSQLSAAQPTTAELPIAQLIGQHVSAGTEEPSPAIMMDAAGYRYEDPQLLKNVTAVFICLPVLLGCCLTFAQGVFFVSSQNFFLLCLVSAFFILMTVVIYGCWLYRVCANVHALGATGLEFSPSSAILWYFVPLLNFVMPYLALQEIWKASAAPRSWKDQTNHPLISLYWAVNVIALLSFAMAVLMRYDAIQSQNPGQFYATIPILFFGSISAILGVLLHCGVICAISNRQTATVGQMKGVKLISDKSERPDPLT